MRQSIRTAGVSNLSVITPNSGNAKLRVDPLLVVVLEAASKKLYPGHVALNKKPLKPFLAGINDHVQQFVQRRD
jgi:hypothetical protein